MENIEDERNSSKASISGDLLALFDLLLSAVAALEYEVRCHGRDPNSGYLMECRRIIHEVTERLREMNQANASQDASASRGHPSEIDG